MQGIIGININFCHQLDEEEGTFIGSAMAELVVQLTIMT